MKKKSTIDFEKPFIVALFVIIFICVAMSMLSGMREETIFINDPATLTASPQ